MDDADPTPDLAPAITHDWRSRPDDLWAAVRQDYQDGVSAPICCRRHGVGLSTLRNRAAREGWRRADLPALAPDPRLDPDDEGVALEDSVEGDLDRIGYQELVSVAEGRMIRAVLRGDANAALRWRRVRMAMTEDEDALRRWMRQDERLARAVRAAHYEAEAETDDLDPDDRDDRDGSDGSDGLDDQDGRDGPDGPDGLSTVPTPDQAAGC